MPPPTHPYIYIYIYIYIYKLFWLQKTNNIIRLYVESHVSAVSLLESGEQALYKSGQHQQYKTLKE